MESEKKISLDGEIVSWRESSLAPTLLLGRNMVYTTINTLAYKPLHLEQKLRYALESYKALFGQKPAIRTSPQIAHDIQDLLYYGFYPEVGNTVNIFLIPTPEGATHTLLMHEATTPYEGYGLLSVRPKAIIANYEIPFEKHQTNISLSAARFADQHASSRGYGIALRANRAGTLISSGDNPLFALRSEELLTTPIGKGARGSAERDMMFEIAQRAGIKLLEEELRVEDVESYEELIVFTPVGLQSIGYLGERRLSNIYATVLEKQLTLLSREGAAQRFR